MRQRHLVVDLMLLGTVVLNEPFGARVMVASALVLAGVAIVRHRRR